VYRRQVCGHVHHAEGRTIQGVEYCNDGDWVESCTALVEHHDGRLEILYWTEEMRARGVEAPDLASDREREPAAPVATPVPAE